MGKADILLDLRSQPFSGAESSFYLFEEDDREGLGLEKGLWFGVSVSDGAARREGLIHLVPVRERGNVDVSINATPRRVELTAKKGKLTIVMDTPSSMRIYGSGLGVKIHKEMPVMSLETITEVRPGVADYNLFVPTGGGGRLVFSRVGGELTIDSQASLTAGGVNICTIWIEPGQDGSFEALVTAAVPAEETLVSKPLDAALAEVGKSFEDFAATLPEPPAGSAYAELLTRCAYAMWIARRPAAAEPENAAMKRPMFCQSRITDTQCHSRKQPFFALATAESGAAMDTLTSVFPAVCDGMMPEIVCTSKLRYAHFPKLHAYALARVLDSGLTLSEEEAEALYTVFRDDLKRTVETHSFAEGRLSALTPGEMSMPSSPLAQAGFPLETPELYTYMIFTAELCGRLERLCGKGSGLEWYSLSRVWLKILTDELWDGESFCCRETSTGRLVKSGSLLCRLPILLAKRLPEKLLAVLAAELSSPRFLGDHGLASQATDCPHFDAEAKDRGAVDIAANALCVLGLKDAWAFDAAASLAALLLKDAEASGAAATRSFATGERAASRPGDAYDAAAAAALIATASAVLR